MSKPSRTQEMVALPANFCPSPNDVICAKGKQAKQHPANRLLKSLVDQHLQEYSECPTKLERSFLVSKILKTIRRNGGFVRLMNTNSNAKQWMDVGDRNAREKIGQAFRDQLHHQFKSSTKAKASIKRKLQRKGASTNGESSTGSVSSCSRSSSMASPYPTTAPLSASFPISAVSIPSHSAVCVTPDYANAKRKVQVEVDIAELEPLPVNDAMLPAIDFDLSWSSLVSSDDAECFGEAMEEMFQAF